MGGTRFSVVHGLQVDRHRSAMQEFQRLTDDLAQVTTTYGNAWFYTLQLPDGIYLSDSETDIGSLQAPRACVEQWDFEVQEGSGEQRLVPLVTKHLSFGKPTCAVRPDRTTLLAVHKIHAAREQTDPILLSALSHSCRNCQR